jgi:DNA primase
MTLSIKEVKDFINKNEFDLAKTLCGVHDGRSGDIEHHQSCPICREGSDRFFFTPENALFHCRKCNFNGDLISLVAKQKGIKINEAVAIIGEAAGIVDKNSKKKK